MSKTGDCCRAFHVGSLVKVKRGKDPFDCSYSQTAGFPAGTMGRVEDHSYGLLTVVVDGTAKTRSDSAWEPTT